MRVRFAIATAIAFTGAVVALWYVVAQPDRRFPTELYAPMFQAGDRSRPYSLIPGWQGTDHGVPVSANEQGLRDEPWPPAPFESLRVVALGDSQTMGVSVDFGAVWSEVLERRLAQASGGTTKSCRVYNVAVPGWNFADESAFLRHHWERLRPRAVVVLFIENDLDDSLTAGDSHQLAASRPPFEPFSTVSDAWIMEGFARAWRDDPTLELTLGNAFKEARRIPYYPTAWLRLPETPSGRSRFDRYERELREFVTFARDRGAPVLVLAQTWEPDGPLDQELARICVAAGAAQVSLNRWTGDLGYFLDNWSNLPLDEHGGENYHALVAALVQQQLATCLQDPRLQPQNEVPAQIPSERLRLLGQRSRVQWAGFLEGPASEVAWKNPENLRRLVSMGDPGGSQTRVLLCPTVATGYLRVVPAKPIAAGAGGRPVLWADTPAGRAFIPTVQVGDSVWGRLPAELAAAQLVELGVVLGVAQDGRFLPLWPLTEIAVHATPPAGPLDWHHDVPLLEGVEGLQGDRWMGRSLRFRLMPASVSALDGMVLRLVLEAMAPKDCYPMRFCALAEDGHNLSEFELSPGGPTTWDIPVAGLTRPGASAVVDVRSDRCFVPHDVDPASADTRELSARVTSLGVVPGRSPTPPTVRPSGDRTEGSRVRIEGLTADLWMVREAVVQVHPPAGTSVLVVEFEAHAPKEVGPMMLTLEDGNGQILATRTVTEPGSFSVEVPLNRLAQNPRPEVRLKSDRVFIPSATGGGNPDGRELSVRVLSAFCR